MLNENKNQKKRCDFDGHLVFLDELFLFFFCIVFVHGFVSRSFVWLRINLGVLVVC